MDKNLKPDALAGAVWASENLVGYMYLGDHGAGLKQLV
jgi:hypothetical protein